MTPERRGPNVLRRGRNILMKKYAVLIALVLSALLPALSPAQENLGKGRISGLVLNETGVPVIGARITAASLQSEAKLEAVTDKNGRFAIMGLGTGRWRITAQMKGYETPSRK